MADENINPGTGSDIREQRHESHAQSTWKNFLKGIRGLTGMSEEEAERSAVCVLGLLEQRMFGEEARNLESQLPLKLRELLQSFPHQPGKPQERFGAEEFLQRIANDLGRDRSEIEPIVRSVFAAVRAQITEGEGEKVAAQLPTDLASLWMMPA